MHACMHEYHIYQGVIEVQLVTRGAPSYTMCRSDRSHVSCPTILTSCIIVLHKLMWEGEGAAPARGAGRLAALLLDAA